MEEGARLDATDQGGALLTLARQVGTIRQSLSNLTRQVADLDALLLTLLTDSAQAGDGGSSSNV